MNNEIGIEQENLISKQLNKNLQNSQEDVSNGISLENAAYFENDLNQDQMQIKKEEAIEPEETVIDEISLYEEKPLGNSSLNDQNEVSPQLFSDDEVSSTSSGNNDNDNENLKSEEEEDFEIPAFLRKQKF